MSDTPDGKVPKVRFRDWTSEWTANQLANLLHFENGYAFQSKFFSAKQTDTIVLTPGSVKIGGGFQEGKGRFYNGQNGADKYVFEAGDIFVTMTDLTPTAQALGYPARVPEDGFTYLHNQRLGKLTDFEGDDEFLLNLLCTDGYHHFIVSTASGTTVKHTSPEKILSFESHLPSLPEQAQIGAYFKSLDRMIGLHQRKHDKLLTLKQAMLQRMFPQDGANTPKIRFKGFCKDWEKKTLKELVEVCSGRDYKHLSSGDIPVYGTGGYMLSVAEALSYDQDAIGIGRKGTIDKPYLLRCPFWTVDTLFYTIPHKEHDLDFVYCVFQRVEWLKKDESTGVPSLSKVAINGIEVNAPCNAEQQKIGHYFCNLDKLITKHATQVEKLKNIKSACLEKMFV